MKLEAVSLKRHPLLNERWVQDRIADDPTLLGLGDLIVKDKERMQSGAGRLDLLLQDPDSLKRYEVEIQLGATDESHVVRTVEYWDIERKRYPQYEHAAVIVAEEITSRFLNVIQLFNGAIPLIALKMTVYKVGDQLALTFVADVDDLATTVFPLTHYAAKAWPGDGPHVTTDPAPAEGEMTLKLEGDTLEVEVGLAWPLVQPA